MVRRYAAGHVTVVAAFAVIAVVVCACGTCSDNQSTQTESSSRLDTTPIVMRDAGPFHDLPVEENLRPALRAVYCNDDRARCRSFESITTLSVTRIGATPTVRIAMDCGQYPPMIAVDVCNDAARFVCTAIDDCEVVVDNVHGALLCAALESGRGGRRCRFH